ncbi:NAD(P)/FAD-dependent oxidoreductase [Mycolicibacterium sp.]|uniref:NAD(P)/FAD-dependent oxidoreductase n=1 Tax=Mycolicibacterium sp. TaxID=2320850 RepID=UPI0037C545F0
MDHREVVVVGGGIVGSFTAYELAKAGHHVVVVDPRPGSGASAGNAGMLVPSYCLPMSNPGTLWAGLRSMAGPDPAVAFARPVSLATMGWLARFAIASRPGRAIKVTPALIDMAVRSIDDYQRLVDTEQVDIGLRRTGWLHVAWTESALRAHLRSVSALRNLGARADILTNTETRAVEPRISANVHGGVYFPGDASLDPAAAVTAVLACAERHGARVLHTRAVGLDRVGDTVDAVVTTSGRIRAEAVVLAVGAATSEVAQRFGINCPRIEPGYGWSLTLPTPATMSRVALMSVDDHVVVNASQAAVRITGGMRFGGNAALAPPPSAFAALRAAADRMLPDLAHIAASAECRWDARPMTASGLPVMYRAMANLTIVSGHGTLGMTLAPATARSVARQLTTMSTRRAS